MCINGGGVGRAERLGYGGRSQEAEVADSSLCGGDDGGMQSGGVEEQSVLRVWEKLEQGSSKREAMAVSALGGVVGIKQMDNLPVCCSVETVQWSGGCLWRRPGCLEPFNPFGLTSSPHHPRASRRDTVDACTGDSTPTIVR
jgi:hypothetical protein